MVEKHLDAIRAKEKEAREHAMLAEKQASEMIETTHLKGRQLLADTKIEGAELIRSQAASARAEAEKDIEQMRAENAVKIEALDNGARKRTEDALGLIIESFRKGPGRS
jgi:hypothetical protein